MDVRIEGLSFQRGRRTVLEIPSLSLRAGRTTAVLGPNGAGKTTLLRLLVALDRPNSGRILLGGQTPASPEARHSIAYVFQEHVFLRRSLRDNFALGLKLRHVPARERAERIEWAAQLLGITHLLDRDADQLSGGEGRRASLARALCLRAPLVLLDEPLSGLDPTTYSHLLNELPKVLKAFRGTAVLVTHDHHEALRLGEDLVVLIDGRVRISGERDAVFLDPKSREAAEMLGNVVLEAGGRLLAARPETLALGAGSVEFSLAVEAVLDLVDRREIVGTVGPTRVHVRLPDGITAPRPRDDVLIHADRVCQVT